MSAESETGGGLERFSERGQRGQASESETPVQVEADRAALSGRAQRGATVIGLVRGGILFVACHLLFIALGMLVFANN